MQKLTVLIVDDHALFRETLSFMINRDFRFLVIAATGSSSIAFSIATENKPDLILMDINMSPVNGFQLTQELMASSPDLKIVALSMHGVIEYAKDIMRIGAMGYVTKNSNLSELLDCMYEVCNGNRYVCTEIRNKLVSQELRGTGSPLQLLSKREMRIAKLLTQGLSSRDIAVQLNIVPRTVDVHRARILKKLKLKNTVSLVGFIHLHGL